MHRDSIIWYGPRGGSPCTLKRDIAELAIQRTGSITKAAAELKIARRTLQRWMKLWQAQDAANE